MEAQYPVYSCDERQALVRTFESIDESSCETRCRYHDMTVAGRVESFNKIKNYVSTMLERSKYSS